MTARVLNLVSQAASASPRPAACTPAPDAVPPGHGGGRPIGHLYLGNVVRRAKGGRWEALMLGDWQPLPPTSTSRLDAAYVAGAMLPVFAWGHPSDDATTIARGFGSARTH